MAEINFDLEVEKRGHPENFTKNTEVEPCQFCKGTGHYQMLLCVWCGGSGNAEDINW